MVYSFLRSILLCCNAILLCTDGGDNIKVLWYTLIHLAFGSIFISFSNASNVMTSLYGCLHPENVLLFPRTNNITNHARHKFTEIRRVCVLLLCVAKSRNNDWQVAWKIYMHRAQATSLLAWQHEINIDFLCEHASHLCMHTFGPAKNLHFKNALVAAQFPSYFYTSVLP